MAIVSVSLVAGPEPPRSEEHTSELQSRQYLVCRLLLEKQPGARSRTLERKRKARAFRAARFARLLLSARRFAPCQHLSFLFREWPLVRCEFDLWRTDERVLSAARVLAWPEDHPLQQALQLGLRVFCEAGVDPLGLYFGFF